MPFDQSPSGGPNRWQQLNWFIDHSQRDVSPLAAVVWLTLFRDSRKTRAKVSQTYLAKRIGCSRSSICRAITELKNAGLLRLADPGGFPRKLGTYQVIPITRQRYREVFGLPTDSTT